MKSEQLELFPDFYFPDDFGPGSMAEYGWYEEETEIAVREIMSRIGCNRTDALIKYFMI